MAAARGWLGEAASGETLGDTRSLGGGGAPPCAWGGASPQTRQLSKGCPLGQLRFSGGAAGKRGRGGSSAPGAWRQGPGGARARPPDRGAGHVSRGASDQRARGGRRALWETKPEVGAAGSQTPPGPGQGGGLGTLQGKGGRVGCPGQGAVRGRLRKGWVEG